MRIEMLTPNFSGWTWCGTSSLSIWIHALLARDPTMACEHWQDELGQADAGEDLQVCVFELQFCSLVLKPLEPHLELERYPNNYLYMGNLTLKRTT